MEYLKFCGLAVKISVPGYLKFAASRGQDPGCTGVLSLGFYTALRLNLHGVGFQDIVAALRPGSTNFHRAG